jgi:uncharacterized membrane-anchored protein YhcB (DUF1043 family)
VESIDPVWLFGGITLVGGILIGVLLLRLFNPAAGDVAKLQAELEQARKDMESYKASVNTHFNKTSDLVNELTQDYVKVYRHLAEGAQTLSETREFTQVLDQPSGQVLISVGAETEQATDPLEAQADQPSVPVEADVPGDGSDATATEPVAKVDDSPDVPVDYARVNEDDSVTEETVGTETESVEDTVKDDDENAAAVSADEVTPSEDDSASAVDAEQQAVADAVDAEQQAVADESEKDSTKKT